MDGAKRGSLIGAVFGLAFVLLNATHYPHWLTTVLHLAAAVTFVVLLVVVWRRPDATGPAPKGFGRGYWLVVAAEVVALFGGLSVIGNVLDAPDAAVGWIAFVVGVHFLALARVWRDRFFVGLGAVLAVLGAAGLVLAAASAPPAAIDAVAGTASGFVLLAASFRRP